MYVCLFYKHEITAHDTKWTDECFISKKQTFFLCILASVIYGRDIQKNKFVECFLNALVSLTEILNGYEILS